jgi:hypothetical protein
MRARRKMEIVTLVVGVLTLGAAIAAVIVAAIK